MDNITQKRCCQCGETKPLSEFTNNKNRKDGKDYCCKACNCKRVSKWQKENPEKVEERNKRWRKRHKDQVLEIARKWCSANRERLRQLQNKTRASNPAKYRARVSRWQKSHPEQRRINEHNRRARQLSNGGTITEKDWFEVLDKYGHKCLCCGASGIKLTIDHVVPVEKGGPNVKENIQPLCGSCNSRKGAKIIDYRPF